jgi:ADP-ribose pyrophosphatase YjhB (NUDIX family)
MSSKERKFNLRVYGLLINSKGEVLLSKEHKSDFNFIKFPGGGLEWGEGLADCLKREFKEELGIQIDIQEHFYTTDLFQESVFNINDQLISIYYLVKSKEVDSIENGKMSIDNKAPNDFFLWKSVKNLEEDYVTFPIDRLVLKKLKTYLSVEL